ncbi:MAG TPA: RNA polymerase sigma-70 factor [Propionibacteriaceae bacterium]|jgi:RNA polymerase sigma-70 factor (ECF subfamily)|nr:RNA polymerase sigma-70 factor [Propionibacteriaceae bacterium]
MTTTPTATFTEQRRRLLGVSYRILGSVADAEDVVQDAWLRWSATDTAKVENPEAFLTTVVTRLSLDRLRALKARREVYSGPWLPEPVAADAGPEAAVELADSLSLALLVVLETLSPLERAAFVLREVFAEPYDVVAEILGRDPAAVRQLVHRARQHVDAGGTRYRADHATHNEVVERFLAACQNADLDALLTVLAPDVVMVSDAGGVGKAPVRPIIGEDKVGRFLIGVTTKVVPGTTVGLEVFNGQLGLVARLHGRAITALAFRVSERQIQTLHVLANPEKLAALDAPIPLE